MYRRGLDATAAPPLDAPPADVQRCKRSFRLTVCRRLLHQVTSVNLGIDCASGPVRNIVCLYSPTTEALLLTSKEIIERTGISRATLNNYIASGLVPRPQVLPPGPEDGAAPRIGYFPDDTIARIEAIQRLKREGWSITRIAEHLGGASARAPTRGRAMPPPVPGAARPQRAVPARRRPSVPAAADGRRCACGCGDVPPPGLPGRRAFRVVWANDEARSRPPVAAGRRRHRPAASSAPAGPRTPRSGRDAILRFHLGDGHGTRAAPAAELFRRPAAGRRPPPCEALLPRAPRGRSRAGEPPPVPAAGGAPARWRMPCTSATACCSPLRPPPAAPASAPAAARPAAVAPAAPRLTPVAVLVATLQDAHGLWVRLTAQEYFELLNEVWTELDRDLPPPPRRARAQAGEVLVCYFLPDARAAATCGTPWRRRSRRATPCARSAAAGRSARAGTSSCA